MMESKNKEIEEIHLLLEQKEFKAAENAMNKLKIEDYPKKNQGEIYWMMHVVNMYKQKWFEALENKQLAVDLNPDLEYYESSPENFEVIDKFIEFKFDM